MDGLADGSFQQVVDSGGDEHFAVEAVDVHQCLVGVHYLLQIDGLITVVGEGCITVEFLVCLDDVFGWCLGLDDGSAEDAAGEVAAVGYEVDRGIEVALYLAQRLGF